MNRYKCTSPATMPNLSISINTSFIFASEIPVPETEHIGPDPNMCHYTLTFYECNCPSEDHVVGCRRMDRTGTHCDRDSPEFRNKDDCSVRSTTRKGPCPRCRAREQTRIEQEAERRELEKYRSQDAEEQRRNVETHEAHLKRAQEESFAEWSFQEDEAMNRALRESAESAQRSQVEEEDSMLRSAMEASRSEFMNNLVDRFGEVVEEGSSQMEAIKRKSTMDWHHQRWGPGGVSSESYAYASSSGSRNAMAELEMKMSSSFSMKESSHGSESHHYTETHQNFPKSPLSTAKRAQSSFQSAHSRSSMGSYTAAGSSATSIPPPPPPPPLPSTTAARSRISTQSEDTANSSTTTTTLPPIPPPPPLPPLSPLPPSSTHSRTSVHSTNSKASLHAHNSSSSTVVAPPPPPPPPPPPLPSSSASGHSVSGRFTDLETELRARADARESRSPTFPPISPTIQSRSPTISPKSPTIQTPTFTPVDYSQPIKDQNIGRFKIGTRHQPIHPSQEIDGTPATPTSPQGPRAPAPSVRLAGTVAPTSPISPGFGVPTGDLRSRLRSSTAGKRPFPRPAAASDQPPNELEALWNRRGIQREVDDDGITAASITPSQSVSQVPTRASSHVGVAGDEDDGDETETEGSVSLRARRLANLEKKRRTGWDGD